MSDPALFSAGFAVTIPAGAGILALPGAAVADGRENDRVQAGIGVDAVAPAPRPSAI